MDDWTASGERIMELAAVALQQASAQTNVTLSMLKKNAQAEQSFINMIVQNAPSGSRGRNFDETV